MNNTDLIHLIKHFMRNEHKIFVEFPDIYTEIPEKRTPQMRGQNTINDIFTKLRTFYLWAIEAGKTAALPSLTRCSARRC